eukprot:1273227-Rhodomonas_salina.1
MESEPFMYDEVATTELSYAEFRTVLCCCTRTGLFVLALKYDSQVDILYTARLISPLGAIDPSKDIPTQNVCSPPSLFPSSPLPPFFSSPVYCSPVLHFSFLCSLPRHLPTFSPHYTTSPQHHKALDSAQQDQARVFWVEREQSGWDLPPGGAVIYYTQISRSSARPRYVDNLRFLGTWKTCAPRYLGRVTQKPTPRYLGTWNQKYRESAAMQSEFFNLGPKGRDHNRSCLEILGVTYVSLFFLLFFFGSLALSPCLPSSSSLAFVVFAVPLLNNAMPVPEIAQRMRRTLRRILGPYAVFLISVT